MHALTTNLPHLALPPKPTTHEDFIQSIRDETLSHCALSADASRRLAAAKLTYGINLPGVRGTTHFESWHNGSPHDFICVAASGEESHLQLIGTTLHELAHVLAGAPAGHSVKWKEAASRLGLVQALASGQAYHVDHFEPTLWAQLALLPTPSDGNPRFHAAAAGSEPPKLRPCSVGIGTRGGKSRGKGSGSRLRKYTCACKTPVVRVASDTWKATCGVCKQEFTPTVRAS